MEEFDSHNFLFRELSDLIEYERVYVLFDCDRTLIPVDSTVSFFKYAELDFSLIKGIFKKLGYTYEGFHEVAEYYSLIDSIKYDLACRHIAKEFKIYQELIEFINRNLLKFKFIFITSGIKKLWENVILLHDLNTVNLIGGNNLKYDRYIVDKTAKGLIVDFIKERNCKVVSFGDSLIDLDMLNKSDYGILVVNEKRNKDIIPLLSESRNIFQISFEEYWHKNLEPISLSQLEEKIKNEII